MAGPAARRASAEPGPRVDRGCEISPERQRTSQRTGGRREKSAGSKRQTTAAASKETVPQDAGTTELDEVTRQELAELRRLRQSLVQVARDIIITLGADPDEVMTAGPAFGPGARGMRRSGGMGGRMRGRGASWDAPGPMRRMPPPGPRGHRGMDGPPVGPRRRGAAMADEDEGEDR